MKGRIEDMYGAICALIVSGSPVVFPLSEEMDNVFYRSFGMSAEDIRQMLMSDERQI